MRSGVIRTGLSSDAPANKSALVTRLAAVFYLMGQPLESLFVGGGFYLHFYCPLYGAQGLVFGDGVGDIGSGRLGARSAVIAASK